MQESLASGPTRSGSRARCSGFQPSRAVGNSAAEGLADPFDGEARPVRLRPRPVQGTRRTMSSLVHLNHRLVQMSLRLLRAEVWSLEGRKRLNRVTARVVPDSALPHLAVVAHARLVVIGGDSQRLHEEIITAGGQIREGRFSRFGSLKEMQQILDAATAEEPSEAVKRKLLDLWPRVGRPAPSGPRRPHQGPHRGPPENARRAGREGGLGHPLDHERAGAGDPRPAGRPRLPAGLPARASPRSSRSSSSGTSMPSAAAWARSPARSRRRPRRSGLGSPTRSPGCSPWR